jgi:hypothetical protein
LARDRHSSATEHAALDLMVQGRAPFTVCAQLVRWIGTLSDSIGAPSLTNRVSVAVLSRCVCHATTSAAGYDI